MADERFGKDKDLLTDFEKTLMKRILSKPQDFPQDFWNGIKGRIEVDPPTTLVSSVTGTYDTPRAHVFSTVAVSHTASGSWQAVTFNTERYDTANMFDATSSTARLTSQRRGTYLVGGHVIWDSNVTGNRYVRLYVNSTTSIAEQGPIAASAAQPRFSIVGLCELDRGDYVELSGYQDSGGTRLIDAQQAYSPEFWMVFVSDSVNAGA